MTELLTLRLIIMLGGGGGCRVDVWFIMLICCRLSFYWFKSWKLEADLPSFSMRSFSCLELTFEGELFIWVLWVVLSARVSIRSLVMLLFTSFR